MLALSSRSCSGTLASIVMTNENCPVAILEFDIRQEVGYSYCRMSREAMPQSTELLRGKLDLLVMQIAALKPIPVWGVASILGPGWVAEAS